MTHLNSDEDSVIGLVKDSVAFRSERELEWDLSFANW